MVLNSKLEIGPSDQIPGFPRLCDQPKPEKLFSSSKFKFFFSLIFNNFGLISLNIFLWSLDLTTFIEDYKDVEG